MPRQRKLLIALDTKAVWITFGRFGTLIGLFLLVAVFTTLKPAIFPTPRNLLNILNQISLLGICSAGLTICLVMNEFDLSIGAIATLGAVLTAGFLPNMHPVLAVPIVLVICTGIGLVNGLVIATLGVSSFMATLGSMTILTGFSYWYTSGSGSILYSGIPKGFLIIGKGTFLHIPYLVFFMIGVLVLLHLFLNHTSTGRHMYAVGGNPEAARFGGIPIQKLKILGFMTSGFLAGLTGVLLVARLGLAEPTIGDRFLFDAFTAVFLGAASIKIGQFHIIGTLIGVLIMGTLFNGFTLLDVPYHLQLVAQGAILIAAVTAAGLWKGFFRQKRQRVD
ncbi:ABC transporter permease [Candidatus Bipolaricaulota bacterium]|nr:ABC transporter permease [Candidatus Bipolaricaulota bacterium]